MNATSTVERLRVIGGDGSTALLVGVPMLGELADRVVNRPGFVGGS